VTARPQYRKATPAWPVLLVGRGVPARGDDSPAADWAMALMLLARVEGHGDCGGFRLGPGDVLACRCGGLVFQVGPPDISGSEAGT